MFRLLARLACILGLGTLLRNSLRLGCVYSGLILAPSLARGETAGDYQAFLTRHCGDCHQGGGAEGGLDLDSILPVASDPKSLYRWERIHDRVRDGEMPPADHPQPRRSERLAFLSSLARQLHAADQASREVVLRRLNRAEYERTLRDLFGARIDVHAMLPEDASAGGFDNIGAALDVSTEQIQSYFLAADRAIDEALGLPQRPTLVQYSKPLADEISDRNLSHHGGDPEKLRQLAIIERLQMRAFGDFLKKLAETAEDDGTLLDRTQVLLGSNLGNAASHDNRKMPILLAGGGYRHGQHLAFDPKQNYPLPNLFVTMLQRLGLEVDAFASSTGTMTGLELT